MDKPQKDIWFPARKYGWGWTFPVTWQGWLFIVCWFAVFVGGLAFAQSNSVSPFAFWSFVLIMVVILNAVCFLKGEKPRWRWGD